MGKTDATRKEKKTTWVRVAFFFLYFSLFFSVWSGYGAAKEVFYYSTQLEWKFFFVFVFVF